MKQYKFSLDQLMELAGQSVAHSIHHANIKYNDKKFKNVLFICGPGNNGGDGLVAARHLKILQNDQYKPEILLLTEPRSQFFQNLIETCQHNEIQVKYLNQLGDQQLHQYFDEYDLIVDSIFGFSVQHPIRPPFDKILESFKIIKSPIFSVDIPSGWDIDKGQLENQFCPQYLISLTLPKLGSQNFKGKHYVGGRFIPDKMAKEYGWIMPNYKEFDQFIELSQKQTEKVLVIKHKI